MAVMAGLLLSWFRSLVDAPMAVPVSLLVWASTVNHHTLITQLITRTHEQLAHALSARSRRMVLISPLLTSPQTNTSRAPTP